MTKETIIKATHQGQLEAGNLDCYVLGDGTRVLSQAGVAKSLGIYRATNLAKFVSGKTIAPFVSNDLSVMTKTPILFSPPQGGKPAYGYKATVLVDICDAILEAKKRGSFPKDSPAANQAEVLIRSFAKVGIIALIDEATGYIKDKKKNWREKRATLKYKGLKEETFTMTRSRNVEKIKT